VTINHYSQHQLYADDLGPAEEVENDRQQRVYRGQPSTVGQVARDRDGLRHQVTNAIPVSTWSILLTHIDKYQNQDYRGEMCLRQKPHRQCQHTTNHFTVNTKPCYVLDSHKQGQILFDSAHNIIIFVCCTHRSIIVKQILKYKRSEMNFPWIALCFHYY
jgi:hypothetical protein